MINGKDSEIQDIVNMKILKRVPVALRVAFFILLAGVIGISVRYFEKLGKNKSADQGFQVPAARMSEQISVSVTGEIRMPGIYKLKRGASLYDLIERAGGLKDGADVSDTEMSRKLYDGQKIVIPAKKGFFQKIGIGKAPEEEFIVPPLEVDKEE